VTVNRGVREEPVGVSKPKPFDIDKRLFVEAWKRVEGKKGGAGVDGVTVEAFGQEWKDNLYRAWNRVSSGSYFPLPVKEVPIPKPGGGVRVLGVPSVADRVVQTVATLVLEPRVEPMFHDDSYGYRPGRAPQDAVGVARRRCWDYPGVVDLDIKGFFDTIPHDKLLAAVDRHLDWDLRWVGLYVRRWLAVPLRRSDGSLAVRSRGCPQGAPISPLLANIFLHYVFDAWIAEEYPTVRFERYCDDIVLHCFSERQAHRLVDDVRRRLAECGLELNESKTRVVYCKNDRRPGTSEHTEFTFLGYTFRPRSVKNRDGKMGVAFTPAVSNDAGRKMRAEVRRWRLHRRTTWTLDDLAADINPVTRGWINYYGAFTRSRLYPTLRSIDRYLMRWLMLKYRRFKGHPGRAWRFLAGLKRRAPDLFAHWGQPAASR
jgi:RNA-directed DNA polymerase